jgi:hypothetical protein
VKNHKKWIEWTNLESGGLEYKGRIYKKEVLNHEVRLMTCIINMMDYNQLADVSRLERYRTNVLLAHPTKVRR